MDVGQLKYLNEIVRFKSKLRAFIDDPNIRADEWNSWSSIENPHSDEMLDFVKHARKRCEENIVHHAKYVIDSIDKELKDNGVI